MPLVFDDTQKRRLLKEEFGLDPDQYDIDPSSGNIFYAPRRSINPNPTAIPEGPLALPPAKAEAKPGMASSALTGAATAVGPAALGLAAAGAAQPVIAPIAAATGPFAPVTEAGLSLGTMLVAGYGGQKLQNFLLPASIKAKISEAQRENPTSFEVGQLAANLPFMKVNPANVLRAGVTTGKTLSNVIRPGVANLPISALEKQNLANVAIGGGLAAGQEIATTPEGQDVSIPRVLAHGAIGAALNEPTKLGGRLLKLPPESIGQKIPPEFTTTEEGKTLAESTTSERTLENYGRELESTRAKEDVKAGRIPPGYDVEITQETPNPKKNIEENILSTSPRVQKVSRYGTPLFDAEGNPIYKQEVQQTGTLKGTKQDVISPFKSAEESAEAIKQELSTESPYGRARNRTEAEEKMAKAETERLAAESKKTEEATKKLEEQAKNRESNYALFKEQVKSGKFAEAYKFSGDLGETYYFRKRLAAEEASGKTEEFPPPEVGKITAEQQKVLDARRKLYQPESSGLDLKAKTRFEEGVKEAGTEGKVKATKSFYDLFTKAFENKRGVKVSLDSRLVDESGQPVKGATDTIREPYKDRVIKINPLTASPDTIPHEFVHSWLEDLKTSPNKREQSTAKNLESALENSKEFKENNPNKLSPNEYLTETSGYEVFNRAVNADGYNGSLKRAWKDFLSVVRMKTGTAKVEDLNNFIARRFLNDPAFVESHITPALGRQPETKTKEEDARTTINNRGSSKTEGEGKVENRPTENKNLEAEPKQEKTILEATKKEGEINNETSKEEEHKEKEIIAERATKEESKVETPPSELTTENETRVGGGESKVKEAESKIKEEPSKPKEETNSKEQEKLNKEEPKRYYQKATQGLGKTPEEIKADFDNVIQDPDFKKQSAIGRALKEIGHRLPIVGSDLDKLALRAGASGKYIAPNIAEALTKAREYEGRWLNPSLESIRNLSHTDEDLLHRTLLSEVKQGKSLVSDLPENLKEPYKTLRDLFLDKQENQIEAREPVTAIVHDEKTGGFREEKRLPKINPNYFPQIPGSKQLDILLNYEGSQAFNKLKEDFINYQKEAYGINDEAAKDLFETMKVSYGGPVKGDITRFGAVRKAEGIGLPNTWLENDLATVLRRYWRRVAKDRGWFDAIEKDHNNLKVLGYKFDAWGDPIKPTDKTLTSIPADATLSSIIDTVQGQNIKINPRLDAVARIVNNLILGPITGAGDILSALPTLAKFSPSIWDTPKLLSSIARLSDGIANARKNGIIKEKLSDIEDVYTPGSELVERLRSIGDNISKWNTRQKLEEFSRGLSQAASEVLIKMHRGLAEEGNAKSLDLLSNLANKKDWKVLSDDNLASRLVELTQGTYDIRGLPSWVINSQLAPFVRLSKWNIEQLNNLHRYAIIPATKGDIMPLVNTLLYGAAAGYISKELREMVSGRKTSVPSWKEIIEAPTDKVDKIRPATYSLAASLSYSGVLGVLGELVKAGLDLSYGNKPTGFNYPLVEVAADTVDNISDAANAIHEGENPIQVGAEAAKRLFSNNVQAARIAIGWATDPAKKELQGERRDLRVFRQLTGRPTSPQSGNTEGNAYLGLESREFKQSEDFNELPGMAQKLIQKAVVKAHGDIEILSRELSSLRRNAVTTMPSLENNPQELSQYLDYLKKTTSNEEAQRRLIGYVRSREINKAKASMIPSISTH